MENNTQKIPKVRKLTRAQIAEGLEAVPMEALLLGASNSKEKKLTHKQVKFAEALAMGESKAGAYRAAYNSKGKPETQSRRGQEVAAIGAVQAQVEAFRVAMEARKHATPEALRALVIDRLTQAALNPDVKPAQQLRALELLGKVTEVAAFTERREIIKTESAGTARERLINSLRQAIQSDSGNSGGASLLAELARRRGAETIDAVTVPTSTEHSVDSQPDASIESQERVTLHVNVESQCIDAQENAENVDSATPPPADPPNLSEAQPPALLSNPHTRSPNFEDLKPSEGQL
jgi:hypothetical protein